MANLTAKFQLVDEMSDKLESMVTTGEELINTWESAADTVSEAFSEATDSAEEMAAALGEQEKAADDAADALGGVGDKAKGAGEDAEGFGASGVAAMEAVSGAIAALGVVAAVKEVGEAFLEASDAAATFESEMAKVSTVADSAQESLSQTTAEVLDLSRETGDATSGLTDAAYQAISAGVATAGAVEFVADANELAVGGFTATATAVDVLTTAINAYQLEVTDSSKVSDIFITTQNLGKTTVDELASSVGNVIPLAAAYNAELANLSTGYAILTSNGIATAESGTYLKSMLSELGDSSSDVAQVILNETGLSFSMLSEQGYSLGDIMDVLGTSVDGDVTAFNELWSSTEAGIGALSILNSGSAAYNDTLSQIENSTGATSAAYLAMTSTTQDASDDMATAMENLSIVIGDDLNPVMEDLYNFGTDSFNWMGEVVEEYPAVTAGLTSTAVGVGLVATAATGFALVTSPMVITAINSITTAMAANPVFLAVTGVVALTAAVTTFGVVLASQESEYDTWTASTQRQYDELERLNSEYEDAVELYGETSKQALSLRYEIDDLNSTFENEFKTIDELSAEISTLIEGHDSLISSYQESLDSIGDTELGTLALITKLDELASSTDTATASEEQMQAIIDELNQSLPELALTYDDVTAASDGFFDNLKDIAQAQAEENAQAAKLDAYVEALQEQMLLEESIAEIEANIADERERMGLYETEDGSWVMDYSNRSGYLDEDSNWVEKNSQIDELKESLDDLNVAYAENATIIQEVESEYEAMADAAKEAENVQVSYEDAVSAALSGVSNSIETLSAEYDAMYESVRSSIDGTIGLFQTMSVEAELSTADMMSAFESQLAYLEQYTENLQLAEEYGLNADLLSSLSDGSEESAAYLGTIIDQIDALGGSTQEASDFITQMNTSFEEVEAAKDIFAATIADMETDFSETLSTMEEDLIESIENMNMDEEAAAAAQETMSAYINSIREQQANAVSAATAVANAVNDALSTSYQAEVEPDLIAYASGTDSAAQGVALVGEEGPELVYFDGGETVLPADETESLIAPTGDSDLYVAPAEPTASEDDGDKGSGDRKITLDINGTGGIEINSGMDTETVVSILTAYIKPVLCSIVQQEIFEEGDSSYVF